MKLPRVRLPPSAFPGCRRPGAADFKATDLLERIDEDAVSALRWQVDVWKLLRQLDEVTVVGQRPNRRSVGPHAAADPLEQGIARGLVIPTQAQRLLRPS